MDITKALDLEVGDSVAFVGAGGKTSLMFALASELDQPVILCTTTHLGIWQAKLAKRHQVVTTPEEIYALDFEGLDQLLLTGPQSPGERLGGLEPLMMIALHEVVKQRRITLLIEADGAKQRNLKAPADHEPVVPDFVDHGVVVAGLKGLGEPLDDESVHRPKKFSHLTGLKVGQRIRVRHLESLLASSHGGLKGLPKGCQRSLFLNQAEGPILIAKGARLGRPLAKTYDRVLIGSLDQPGPGGPVLSVLTQTAGIILAAGGSERLGEPKQLLNWEGKPFLYQVVHKALEAGIGPIIVVTGADREAVEAVIKGLPVQVVHNPHWEEGQSSSMRVGLGVLPDRCDNVMFLLSDQPQVSPVLIRQLIERYAEHRAPITAPLVNSRRGNPVLFGRVAFEALSNVTGDRGGRAVFNQFEVDWLPWIDDRVLLDVDQTGDITTLIKAFFTKG